MNRHDRRAGQGPKQGPKQGSATAGAFAQAVGLHQAGRLAEAEQGYAAVLLREPRHQGALHLLGVLHHQSGRHESAAELIGKALAGNPQDPALHGDLGQVLRAMGRLDEALACSESAAALRPEAPESHFNLANSLIDLGRREEAVERFRHALALRPAYVEAHNNLGELLHRMGDLIGAERHLRQGVRLRPDLPEPVNNLGNLLADLGDLAGAVALYRQALRFRPDYRDALRNLAAALVRQGKPAEAMAQIDRLLALAPDDRQAALARAAILIDQGEAAQALPIVLADLARGPTPAGKSAFVRALATLDGGFDIESVARWLPEALAEPWGSPRQLAKAAIICLSRDLGPERDQDPAALAGNPLLLALLQVSVIGDIAIERRLTDLRAGLLARWEEEALLPLHAALAQQCFINDYAYSAAEAEFARAAALRSRLEADLAEGRLVAAGMVAAVACYAPLIGLEHAEALLAMAWPEPAQALIRQQVLEPSFERRLAGKLPALTEVRDVVSKEVRQQYEESPYPRWVKTAPVEAPIPLDLLLRRRFPGGPYRPPETPGSDLAVLIAGCGTGQHPIQTAQRYAGARIMAIDLSRASLGYAARKAEEAGLTSISFAQADILELGGMDAAFDLIESVGVLHHLNEPMAGWRVLERALRPGGVMRIGLYSELGRRGVVAGRAMIAAQGLGSTDVDIRAARTRIMAAPAEDPVRAVLKLDDFFSLSECRDLLFHVQEHRFTIPRIRDALAELGLTFLGFVVEPGVEAAYRSLNPEPADFYDLDRWDRFEQAHPDCFIGMYHFFAQKGVGGE